MALLWAEEQGLSAKRWQLPSFELPPAPPPPPDAAATAARMAEIEAEAAARGYALGELQGRAAGLAAAEAQAARVRAVLDALATPLSVLDAELERVLIAMTLEAARRIAQQELAVEPARVAAVVRDAAAALGSVPRALRVHVAPEDYGALTEVLSSEISGAGWSLVADGDVLPGGCRVSSEHATVNASLDARAAGLAHELLGAE
ncbi:MAG: FliH/SctL family protein [Stagnimonas sp.]|nr:FliH/SctL family protein [Stagnimonas sp.]